MSPSHVPALARHLVLTPLDRLGRAEVVAQRLAEAIQMGLFAEGEQLPSEADFAAQLGVSPVTLREALATLRNRGLVRTRRGRGGGTFVSAQREVTAAHLRSRLVNRSVDDLRDIGDLWAAVAGAAAWLAAQRASAGDVARLRRHLDAILAAGDPGELHRAEARFHIEIAAISQSVRLTNQTMVLQTDVSPLVRLAAGEEEAPPSAGDTERALLAAIERREADHARDLAVRHAADGHARLVGLHMRLTAADGTRTDGATAMTPPAVLDAVAEPIETIFSGLSEARDALLGVHAEAQTDGRKLHRADLPPVREVLLEQLDRLPALLAGIGVVFAPGVLADAPLWLDWWVVGEDEPPRFLLVNFDPARPEFYDYVSADWFSVPYATRERAIVGPFVDYSGTYAHSLTVALPVLIDGAPPLAVVGADVDLNRLEAALTPILRRTERPTVLVNRDGRVLISTDPAHVSGTLVWPDGAAAADDATLSAATGFDVHRSRRLPWTLLVAA